MSDDIHASVEEVEEQQISAVVGDPQEIQAGIADLESLVAFAQPLVPVVANIAAPEEIISVTVTSVGPPGKDSTVPGPPGPVGPPGDSPQALGYVHEQMVSAKTWVISHNLNFYPNVTVIDSANTEYEGDLDYIDQNTIRIRFSAAFSGRAILS